MMNLSEIKFVDAASSAITSTIFDNYKGENITLQASGTATAFSAKLEGKADINADWKELALINLKDFATASVITTTDIMQAGIVGVTQIRVNVTSVSGGNLTIFGRVTE